MKFLEIAVLTKPQPLKDECLVAAATSLKRAGYRVRVTMDETAPESVLLTWSWGKAEIARQKNPGAVICCFDHGYTKYRSSLINTGWSVTGIPTGLNGFAEHVWNSDPRRAHWLGLGAELRPQRDTGLKRALLLGQVYGDAMIRGQVLNYKEWLSTTAHKLTEDGYRVTFRPHPVMVRRGQAGDYGNLGRLSPYEDLWVDLSQADLAVALNSNGLVAAFLDGIPARWYNKGSMLSPLEAVTDEVRFWLRARWLSHLAWAQWTIDELRDGTWIKHHAPIMHRIVETGECRPWHAQRLSG